MLKAPIRIEAANPLARRLARVINHRVARAPFDYSWIDTGDLAREAGASFDEVAHFLEEIGGERGGVAVEKFKPHR